MKPLSARAPEGSALLFFLLPLAAAPVFSDAFVPVKWITAYTLVTGLFAVAWAGGGRLAVWVPTGIQRAALAAFTLFAAPAAWHSLHQDPASFVLTLAPWLLALALASSALLADPAGFARQARGWNLLALCLLVPFGFAQWAGWDPMPSLLAGAGPEGLAGNPNFQGEYLGLAMLADLTLASRAPLSPRVERGRWALLACALLFILVLRCRAVLLALGLTAAASLARSRLSRGQPLLVGAVAFLLVAGSLTATAWVSRGWGPGKVAGFEQRIARWQNTAAMALASPWVGHGLGTFAGEYPRYHSVRMIDAGSTESSRVTHAHNDWLELAAELGLPAALAGLVFWAPLAAGFAPFLFLFLDSQFAFPFHHPLPVFLTALLIPLLLPAGVRPVAPVARAASVALLLAAAGASAIYAGAKWAESRMSRRTENLALLRLSCRAMPSIAENCLAVAQLELAAGRTEEAVRQLREVLGARPFDPKATRWLTFAQFDSGQPAAACARLRGYLGVFGEANSAGEVFRRLCSAEPGRADP